MKRFILMAICCLPLLAVAEPESREEAIALLNQHRIPITSDTLRRAAMNLEAETVHALLMAGVDPNERGGSLPQSTLSLATMRSCREADPLYDPDKRDRILDMLLEAGADPNAAEMAGTTTLIMISQRCPGEVVQKLLDAGAETEARSPQGFTALSMAFTVGNLSAAKALIDHGARLPQATLDKLFPEPPEDPKLAELVRRAGE